MQNFLLSCDWGTSSFRLKLLDLQSHQVLDEVSSERGAAVLFQEWKEHGDPELINKEYFYLCELQRGVQAFSDKRSVSLSGCPVVISGMASSSIGIKELPYAPLPFSIDGSDAIIHPLPAIENFPHKVWLISGASHETDVMRGEETQMIGLGQVEGKVFAENDYTCIFPGTHCKHIKVEKGSIVDIKTFMTGELFNLMVQHSILKDNISLSETKPSLNSRNMHAFCIGIDASQDCNLLHTLFSVRINHLFRRLTREENYFYLSGLLIGTELRNIQNERRVILCCGSKVRDLYQLAIEKLNLSERTLSLPATIIDHTAAEGHLKIFKNRIVTLKSSNGE